MSKIAEQLEAELTALRGQAQKDNLRAEDADRYEQWLLDIGRNVGCGHVDERLPRCIEEEFQKLQNRNLSLRNIARVHAQEREDRTAELVRVEAERDALRERVAKLEQEADALADFAADSLELRVGDTNILQRLNAMAGTVQETP